MIFYVDIDNTITQTNDCDYENAQPIYERINKINKLYNEGHTIIYWTARGSGSGKQYFELTFNQLKLWKALFHELRMGKPMFDIFIDDKAFNADAFFM